MNTDRIKTFERKPELVKAILFAGYTEGLGPAEWNGNEGGVLWRWLRSFNASFRMTQEANGPAYMLLRTRDGHVRVDVGNWIVRTRDMEFEVYSSEAFYRLFQEVQPEEQNDE